MKKFFHVAKTRVHSSHQSHHFVLAISETSRALVLCFPASRFFAFVSCRNLSWIYLGREMRGKLEISELLSTRSTSLWESKSGRCEKIIFLLFSTYQKNMSIETHKHTVVPVRVEKSDVCWRRKGKSRSKSRQQECCGLCVVNSFCRK